MKKVLIVGGGISGLSAGVFSRLNGFETEIFEAQAKPGGECTSWKRKDYIFDGAIRWLIGTKKGTAAYDMFKTLGAFEDDKIVMEEIFLTVEHNGKKLYFYRDVDKLKEHLLEVAPEDTEMIKELCKFAKKAKSFETPVDKHMPEMTIFDNIKFSMKMSSMGPIMMKYGKVDGVDYFKKFKSTLIKNALKTLALDTFPAYAPIAQLGSVVSYDGGWPLGGSAGVSENICNRFKELGGTIHLSSPVKRVIQENGKAVGIELENGQIAKGDYVISSTDITITLNKLLEGKIKDEAYNEILSSNSGEYTFASCVFVSLGIAADLSKDVSPLVVSLNKPLKVGNDLIEDIYVNTFKHEKSFAPEGKTAAVVTMDVYDYNYWKKLYDTDVNKYKSEKERIAKAVIEQIEITYPKAKGNIEVAEVATPVTYNRIYGAYKGAWMGYGRKVSAKYSNHKCKLEGIDNFALAGQWISSPGAVTISASTGKFAVQEICQQADIKFRSK